MLKLDLYIYLPKGKDATPLNIPFMPQSLSLPGKAETKQSIVLVYWHCHSMLNYIDKNRKNTFRALTFKMSTRRQNCVCLLNQRSEADQTKPNAIELTFAFNPQSCCFRASALSLLCRRFMTNLIQGGSLTALCSRETSQKVNLLPNGSEQFPI